MTASIAKAAAGELYDSLMADNRMYEMWQSQCPGLNAKAMEQKFINKNWGRCIDFARATMIEMLARADIAQAVKDEIYEVLLLENTLPVGKMSVADAKRQLLGQFSVDGLKAN